MIQVARGPKSTLLHVLQCKNSHISECSLRDMHCVSRALDSEKAAIAALLTNWRDKRRLLTELKEGFGPALSHRIVRETEN